MLCRQISVLSCKHAAGLPGEPGLSLYVLPVVLSTNCSVLLSFGITVKSLLHQWRPTKYDDVLGAIGLSEPSNFSTNRSSPSITAQIPWPQVSVINTVIIGQSSPIVFRTQHRWEDTAEGGASV